ncbi:NAD-binding D-isomer specific 2-hydroxyacid dehydrogenase [Streptomyces albus]|uniref:NAD-binding D-isomer specific 2-hydroxyacid dehydrogenase n=2 Tax=Streptomyces TaxID=1883 RepID=A0A0B5EW45_STRA4|nr:NAD-binding D-isomer specific 2-hydroxyacid dehydrogenase [Streptomyces albus]AOU80316.1 NAD-binding D-isomer specific 2-hydroxyacid dehydrogenase [Streptomyces albus]AYN36027.1 NAD-binding D-isomer specific 2-hydroxyacid dehydrogenase [Streptomyces albus]
MTYRPCAAMVMDAEVAEQVLPGDLRRRLARSVTLVPPSGDGSLPVPGVLAETEILLTSWGCPPLTAEVLAAAPRLAAVVHAAGSVKALVGDAVWERGILVSSAAEANAGPVVDFTLAAVTFAAKGALRTAARYTEGPPAFAARTGTDARTIGVIGASRIGRRVLRALRGSAAGYRLLLADPYVSLADAASLGAELVTLPELCRRSSVVSVHAPELPETRGLLDAAMLALIPDGGVLVNTARGSLVDTEALTRECAEGRLDAYLDVTEPEPLPPGHPLLALPNVQVTPHIAGAQGSEARRLGAFAAAEVERFLAGEPLSGAVRREELARLA